MKHGARDRKAPTTHRASCIARSVAMSGQAADTTPPRRSRSFAFAYTSGNAATTKEDEGPLLHRAVTRARSR